jgi:hypothetical protein
MDFFEECKADWLKQRREDYLRHPFTPEEIDRAIAECKRRDRLRLLRDSLSVGLFLATLAAFAGVIAVETSGITRIGTALLMLVFVIEFLSMARADWRKRHRRLDLPLKPYLIEERRRVVGELRRMKTRLVLYAMPLVWGVVLLQSTNKNFVGLLVGFIMMACITVVAGLVVRLPKAGRELRERLQTLEGDLANIAEIEAEGE